uniref:Uncharacterized protein n=1 Tax=Acrobeloides nanus TaxID=290746 RepID=A0A914CK46_9BILA
MNLEIQCEKLMKLYAALQQLFTTLFIEEISRIEKEGEENGRLELEKTFEDSTHSLRGKLRCLSHFSR